MPRRQRECRRTNWCTAARRCHESYGARYPAATAGSSRRVRASVIVSAAREKALAPCTRQLAQQRRAADANPPGDEPGPKRAGVEQHDPLEPLRARASRAPSPMAPPQSWATSVTRRRSSASTSRTQVVDVIGQPQRPRLQVAQPAAEVIGRHAAVAVPQGEDQPPPVERPGGIAVDEQQRRLRRVAVAFVEVVQRAPATSSQCDANG